MSGTVINSGTITNGTLDTSLLTGNITNNTTITGGNIQNATITNNLPLNGTISGGTFSHLNVTGSNNLNGTLSSGTLSANLVQNANVSNPSILTGVFNLSTLSGINCQTLSNGMYSNMVIDNANTNSGTLSECYTNVSFFGTTTNMGTLSGGFLYGSTLLSTNSLSGSLTGGMLNTSTFSGFCNSTGSFTGNTLASNSLIGNSSLIGTLTGGTLSSTLLNNTNLFGTLSGGTVSGLLQNPSTNAGISYINGGNVGIGTSSPSTTLQVAGTFQATTMSLTTLNVTADPTNTETIYGDYASLYLGTTSYTFDGSGTDSQVLIWNTPNFSQNVTHSAGVFYLPNAGIYQFEIIMQIASAVTTDIITYLQNSSDGQTGWTTVFSGSRYSRIWTAGNSEYVNMFHVNITSVNYWRLLLLCNNAVTVLFTSGFNSKLLIANITSSYITTGYAYFPLSTTSSVTASNRNLIYSSTPTYSSGDLISTTFPTSTISLFNFATNGTYLISIMLQSNALSNSLTTNNLTDYMILKFTTNAGTSSITNNSITYGFLRDYFTTGEKRYCEIICNINNIHAIRVSGNSISNNLNCFYLGISFNDQPNVTFDFANSYVLIRKIYPEIYINNINLTTTSFPANTDTIVPFYALSKKNISFNNNLFSGSTCVFPINGIYYIVVNLGKNTTAVTNPTINIKVLYSADNITFNQYENTTNLFVGTMTFGLQQRFSTIINVNNAARYWKFQINPDQTFAIGNVSQAVIQNIRMYVCPISYNNRTYSNGLNVKKYYYPGEIISINTFQIEPNSVKYLGVVSPAFTFTTIPTTLGIGVLYYAVNSPFASFVFKTAKPPLQSVIKAELIGFSCLFYSTWSSTLTASNYSNISSTITCYLSYINSYQTITIVSKQAYTGFNTTASRWRYDEIPRPIPLTGSAINTGNNGDNQTITCYMNSSSSFATVSASITNFNSMYMVITETAV